MTFREVGQDYSAIKSRNAEVVGFYYMLFDGDDDSLANGDNALAAVSETIDDLNWSGAWRVFDPAVESRGGIIRATGNIIAQYPAIFIVDAQTMQIVRSTLTRMGEPGEMDIVAVLDELSQ